MHLFHFGRYVAVLAIGYLVISILIWFVLVRSDTEPFTGSRRSRRTKLEWKGLLVVTTIAVFWPLLFLYAFYRLFRTDIV
jgi:membrane protease YdiL (CAAX protease family)